MALLLALFVIAPSLEAVACASDGCETVVSETVFSEAASPDAADVTEPSDEGSAFHDCRIGGCHCFHVATNPVQATPDSICTDPQAIRLLPSSDDPAFRDPISLDRPPRV